MRLTDRTMIAGRHHDPLHTNLASCIEHRAATFAGSIGQAKHTQPSVAQPYDHDAAPVRLHTSDGGGRVLTQATAALLQQSSKSVNTTTRLTAELFHQRISDV